MQISKFILSAVVAASTILGIGAASAADMAVKARPAPIPVPEVYSWAGFYLGVNLGGSWRGNSRTYTLPFPSPTSAEHPSELQTHFTTLCPLPFCKKKPSSVLFLLQPSPP